MLRLTHRRGERAIGLEPTDILGIVTPEFFQSIISKLDHQPATEPPSSFSSSYSKENIKIAVPSPTITKLRAFERDSLVPNCTMGRIIPPCPVDNIDRNKRRKEWAVIN